MKKDYDYKKYDEIVKDLETKGYFKISVMKIQGDLITKSFELWTGGGHSIIVEKYTDEYAALYIDIENAPNIK